VKLEAVITELDSSPVGRLTHFSNLEVTDALNDSRTARVTISLYDEAMRHVQALSRMVKITYGPYLVFWGYILRPVLDFGAGTCELNLHDPTLKLKHHYHHFGDAVVNDDPDNQSLSYSFDGRGLRLLMDSAYPTQAQLDNFVPGLGIRYGENSYPNQPDEADGGIWLTAATRGQNVWESMTAMAGIAGGPEFRFVPIDEDHPGHDGSTPEPGVFCELEISDRLGSDRENVKQFTWGMGTGNTESIVMEIDGDQVRNDWTQVYPGGEKNTNLNERSKRGRVWDESSIADYGLYEGYEASQTKDKKKTLVDKATAWVRAYRRPLNMVTITPRTDSPDTLRWMYDYEVGDRVMARAKRGLTGIEQTVRITSTTLNQSSGDGDTRTTIQAVPVIEGPVSVEEDPVIILS